MDVEQIMREIRARIAQRHGIELSDQQVQDLAARRLESILDPRAISPALLDQLRRSAGARPATVAAADSASVPYEFEDTTLYDSPNAFTRAIRRLLNPLLKLFFNPNPLIRAMHIQSRLNVEAAQREGERDQRQAEWNALHYEILRRLVTETTRVSLEVQSLAHQVESLSAKVDFNERRVRGIEGVMHQSRPGGGREREAREPAAAAAVPAPAAPQPDAGGPALPATAAPEAPAGEGPRRRRRRRRRRGGGTGDAMAPAAEAGVQTDVLEGDDSDDAVEGPDAADLGITVAPGRESDGDADEESGRDLPFAEAARDSAREDTVTTGTDAIDQVGAASGVASSEPPAPERITPQLIASEPEARQEAAPEIPAPAAPDKAES